MDLVSNLASTMLSKAIEGNKEVTSQVDLNDNTFANMLDKQLNNQLEQNGQNFINNLGIPSISGLDLGELDGHNLESQFKAIKPTDDLDINLQAKYNSGKDFSMEEVLTLFNPLFDTKPLMAETTNNGVFNFERKTAANFYNRYAKNIITDISEFAENALKIS